MSESILTFLDPALKARGFGSDVNIAFRGVSGIFFINSFLL